MSLYWLVVSVSGQGFFNLAEPEAYLNTERQVITRWVVCKAAQRARIFQQIFKYK